MGVVTHVFKPSIQEAEADRGLGVQGQPDLHSEFQASWDCKETLSQKDKK